MNRPVAEMDAFGFVTTPVYDALSRVQAITDANGNTTTTVFDSLSRTLAEVNALGCRATMGYDPRGGRVAVTNARGFTWTASFDALGRQSASLDPLGRRTTMAFDARSLPTGLTDGKGQVQTRLFDAIGRQTGTQYADGTIVTMAFDLLSRKLTEANQNGIWTRSCDALGQRLTEVGPGYPSGLPLTSVFDPAGNRAALQTWRGSRTWTYDGLNRTRTLTDIEGGLYTWSYDLHQRLSELDYANGVIFTATYSPQGWPSQGSYASASTPIELLAYPVVDKVGNPLTLNQYWGGAFQTGRNMSYDAANQLIAWGDSDTSGPAVVLDPDGNPSTASVGGFTYTYTYDAADELVNLQVTTPAWTFFNSATFTYDGSGSRVGEQFYQLSPNGATVDRTTYTWDAANHLLKIQQSNVGAVDLTNSYRPDGLRHQRSDSSGTTQVLWDGDDPLAQVDTAGTLKEFWSWGGALPGGNWSRLAKKHYPSTNPNPDQYAHGDWQGTVVALSLPNGTALSRSQPLTRPWGQETAQTPLSWLGNHGYWAEGQLARPMHYVRARWYVDGGYDGNGGAAVSGGPGWLSPDPLGFGGGDGNLYRYVRNRPTVKVDPSGLAACPPGPMVVVRSLPEIDPADLYLYLGNRPTVRVYPSAMFALLPLLTAVAGCDTPEEKEKKRKEKCASLSAQDAMDVCGILDTEEGYSCALDCMKDNYAGADYADVLGCVSRWCKAPNIVIADLNDPNCKGKGDEAICGYAYNYQGSGGQIYICPTSCPPFHSCNSHRERRDTVIHEAIHACRILGPGDVVGDDEESTTKAADCIAKKCYRFRVKPPS